MSAGEDALDGGGALVERPNRISAGSHGQLPVCGTATGAWVGVPGGVTRPSTGSVSAPRVERVDRADARTVIEKHIQAFNAREPAADSWASDAEMVAPGGTVTGRGGSAARGVITGTATFIGGTAHALPFLISDLSTALAIALSLIHI